MSAEDTRIDLRTEELPEEIGRYLPPGRQDWLRPYQARAVLDAIEADCRSPLVVVPTGGGKSRILSVYTHAASGMGSVILLTHRKELIEQNAATYEELTGARPSIYSAGLGSKRVGPVTFGGVASFANIPPELVPDDVCSVVIDEAHREPPEGTGKLYSRSFAAIAARNPDGFTRLGLSATPYRGDRVSLIEHGTYDRIVHETLIGDLVRAGWLARPRGVCPAIGLDLGKLQVKRGEYTDESQAIALEERVGPIADEIVRRGADRPKWIVFLPTVATCRVFERALGDRGIRTGVVVGETKDRDAILRDFQTPDGPRAILNCNVLLEGFDATEIGMVAIVRATTSPVAFVQAAGRGLRTHPGKEDCLILDFGANFQRHGTLDRIDLSRKPGTGGEAITKTCGKRKGQWVPDETGNEGCGEEVAGGCGKCPHCGYLFDRTPKVFSGDGKEIDLVAVSGLPGHPRAVLHRVERTQWDAYTSKNGNPCLRTQYFVKGLRWPVREFQRRNAAQGFLYRGWISFHRSYGIEPPRDIPSAIAALQQAGRSPLAVWAEPAGYDGSLWNVVGRIFEGDPIPERMGL